ncbi:glycerophosphodiester phosphodiesterase [Acinetobacter tandoii]|uniref:glycerophosphodiester phosphodiesterase n=1 Tax=Acinetobacter tandoii TaxID=202954 RepID=UPI000C20C53F|nr:glycerophosphodiester phosphodiesterase [Acinetobacter tandoii]PJG44859.1 glycerophosphodiester phosphodiesterase [Acinetobacter tandoii]
MQIIGHRGARGEAPENTLGGFQYLHDLGIRAVEFDVRQLKDDTLVVMHDDNFLRTTSIDFDLYNCTIDDLRNYNQAAIWMDWQPQVTPTLEQSLNVLSEFSHLEVEVKAVNDLAAAERLIQSLHHALTGFEHNAVITSFDLKIHQALQQSNSPFKRGLLIEDESQEHAIEQALSFGCSRIGWMNQLATDAMIQATQAAGLKVSVWTVNDVERAKHLQACGIDGLITDFPTMMLQQLDLG